LSQKQYLKILKPKTRPVQIEPWFYRYLNAGQLKVLSAIIAHADYATRSKDSFASNKTIAFYGGFGLINSDTKDYEHFQSLTQDEKIAYKKKKMRNAIQTVKNIKRQLEELGVIKREIINTKSYAVVDLEWAKDRYLKEFDEYFNDTQDEQETTENDINKELELITKLANEGNISKSNLKNKLESIADKLKDETIDAKDAKANIPDEDIEKTVDFIMNSKTIIEKIATGKIKNPEGYKKAITKQIREGTFKGAENYHNQLMKKVDTNEKETKNNPIEMFTEIYESTQRVDYAFLEASKGLSYQQQNELLEFKKEFELHLTFNKLNQKKRDKKNE